MTKDFSNCSIQFRFESITSPDSVRGIWWRICPSELGWWDRLFHNPWRRFYKERYTMILKYISPRVWKEELSLLKTYKDAVEWQKAQYKERDDFYNWKVKVGEYWPK